MGLFAKGSLKILYKGLFSIESHYTSLKLPWKMVYIEELPDKKKLQFKDWRKSSVRRKICYKNLHLIRIPPCHPHSTVGMSSSLVPVRFSNLENIETLLNRCF
jgi:hypothetical protein